MDCQGDPTQLPLELVFRNIKPSKSIENQFSSKSPSLVTSTTELQGAEGGGDTPHQHSGKGKLYHVQVEVAVPHKPLMVNRNPVQNQAHENVYVAIRDAFGAARRQLTAYADRA